MSQGVVTREVEWRRGPRVKWSCHCPPRKGFRDLDGCAPRLSPEYPERVKRLCEWKGLGEIAVWEGTYSMSADIFPSYSTRFVATNWVRGRQPFLCRTRKGFPSGEPKMGNERRIFRFRRAVLRKAHTRCKAWQKAPG